MRILLIIVLPECELRTACQRHHSRFLVDWFIAPSSSMHSGQRSFMSTEPTSCKKVSASSVSRLAYITSSSSNFRKHLLQVFMGKPPCYFRLAFSFPFLPFLNLSFSSFFFSLSRRDMFFRLLVILSFAIIISILTPILQLFLPARDRSQIHPFRRLSRTDPSPPGHRRQWRTPPRLLPHRQGRDSGRHDRHL
jgi:hypothetical protein